MEVDVVNAVERLDEQFHAFRKLGSFLSSQETASWEDQRSVRNAPETLTD
jgi:hypothetical protein